MHAATARALIKGRPMTQFAKGLSCAALDYRLVAGPALAHPDPEDFVQSAFLEAPQIVECTLEAGAEAQCCEFTLSYPTRGLEIGPFCPATLDETGGLRDWDGENAGLYRLDRAYFEILAEQGYRFYDADGNIAISDPGTGGQPQVDHACLMATPDESVVITLRLPVDPVMAKNASDAGDSGQDRRRRVDERARASGAASRFGCRPGGTWRDRGRATRGLASVTEPMIRAQIDPVRRPT
ncbi:hypothetical protein [Antarctobacter heliothermus]|nr:hypothetical protein [Antarctobacter heliothermus]